MSSLTVVRWAAPLSGVALPLGAASAWLSP